MKKLTRLAVILIALFTALLALNAWGQSSASSTAAVETVIVPPTSSLPARLPIGNPFEFRDYAVTNVLDTNVLYRYITISVRYTNNLGKFDGWQTTKYYASYNSYESFRTDFVANTLRLCGMIRTNNNYTNSQLRLIADVSYTTPDLNLDFLGLWLEGGIGKASDVTANILSDIQPTYIRAIVPIPELKAVRIETASSPDGKGYTNVWDSVSKTWTRQTLPVVSPLPKELTEGNFLALSEWYSVATYKARITVTTGDQTLTYNRYGNPLAASVNMTRSNLEVLTSGDIESEDIGLESSVDNVTWTTIPAIFTSSGNIATTPVNAVRPHEFFRVTVR